MKKIVKKLKKIAKKTKKKPVKTDSGNVLSAIGFQEMSFRIRPFW